MKSLKDLSKNELIGFITHYPPGDINIFDELACCASCGETPDAKYYYVCDDCEAALSNEDNWKEEVA